ncbi:hypothetical protein [Azospirillum argentinense]|uniref:hypothetical protein n=1 Tax=Azospirillum argentinense TaxID=2970906 RepID=UPI00158E083E|nr:hypothetical protein [Azospirillum argentinense]
MAIPSKVHFARASLIGGASSEIAIMIGGQGAQIRSINDNILGIRLCFKWIGRFYCVLSASCGVFEICFYFKYSIRSPMHRANPFKESMDTLKGGNAFGRGIIFFVAGRSRCPMRPVGTRVWNVPAVTHHSRPMLPALPILRTPPQ